MNKLPEDSVSPVLKGYRLERSLARRPGREVWLAAAPDGRPVVLKLLDPAGMSGWKDLELFEREARILSQLDHPGIPVCLEAFELEGRFVLVEAWVAGETLAAKLARDWRPGEAELKEITRQLLGILDYLHSHSPPLVHRDLKPSNLLLGEHSRLWLLDFGAVSDLSKPGGGSTVVGTFGYMAPEQAMGRSGPRSDLYGVGATLLHLLTGMPPEHWPRQGFELLLDALGLNPFWRSYLGRLLAVSPQLRFATAPEALEALDRPLPRSRAVRAGLLGLQAGADGLRIRIRPRKGPSYALLVGLSLLSCLPFQNLFLPLWLSTAGLTIYLSCLHRTTLRLNRRWLLLSRRLPCPTARIERIQVIHNPYRRGLRIELRRPDGQLQHRLLDLDLSPAELESVRSELTRSLRRLQSEA